MKLLRIGAGLLLLAACSNPQPVSHPGARPQASTNGIPPLDVRGRGTKNEPVTFNAQSGNRRLYALVAASYRGHAAQRSSATEFSMARVTFFDKDGTTLQARAPVATIRDDAAQVFLTGGVHAATSTGMQLTCDKLTYDRRTGKIHGQGHVRITGMQGGSREVLTGDVFTSNIRLTQMVMK